MTTDAVLAIDHVQLAAPRECEDEARRFFGELLGLREIPKPAALADRGGVWFALGAHQQLHIGLAEPFAPARKAHPALRVRPDQLHALADRLTQAGHRVEWAPEQEIPGARRFHTHDPWGNRIELISLG